MQNSVSFNAPSRSRSPSFTIASASSRVIPCNPSKPAFLLRLSGVIRLVSTSASSLNPPHSSDTNVSTSSFSAITGNKSSYSCSILSSSKKDIGVEFKKA
ncbi:hypothetical protein V2J09_008496 [Rumex salicifolius]